MMVLPRVGHGAVYEHQRNAAGVLQYFEEDETGAVS